MSKIYVQNFPTVLESAASLAAAGSISGSALCNGYAQIIGGIKANVILNSPSGLAVEQSFDRGSNWDLVSGSDAIAASIATGCVINIVGNAVRVKITNGASDATSLRTYWQLKPI